jgi:hypothetical protein
MMPPVPPDRERGKKTTIKLRRERQMWAVDMSTTASDKEQRKRAADEGIGGKEGEDDKGNGDGDVGVG